MSSPHDIGEQLLLGRDNTGSPFRSDIAGTVRRSAALVPAIQLLGGHTVASRRRRTSAA